MVHLMILTALNASVPQDPYVHDEQTLNPIAAYYGGSAGYPSWTDTLQWYNQIDMSLYGNGNNAFEKFENARDELAAQGGGVLFYPAGEYDFSDAPLIGPNGRGLMLKQGVVILGETPTIDDDARDGQLQLLTKFIFPYQTKTDSAGEWSGEVPHNWSIVGLYADATERISDQNYVGIAWIHLIGATIYWGPDMIWGETYATAASWLGKKAVGDWQNRQPDGTHPADPFAGGGPKFESYVSGGTGRFVFGCVIEDAAVLDDIHNYGAGPDGFFTYRFGARIGVYGSRVFVANNLLPKSDKNFKYKQLVYHPQTKVKEVAWIMFDYGHAQGVQINKDLLGWARGGASQSAYDYADYYEQGTGYFEPGVIVRDNYVWNHGNKGFDVSGKWVTIQNNHNERVRFVQGDDPYNLGTNPQWQLTLNGYARNKGNDDNLSRAFDLAGQALWVDHNYMTGTGSYPGNDGESILCQLHGGTDILSWAVTHNYHEKGNGQDGYFCGWDVDNLGLLIAWNTTPGWVGNAKAGRLIDAAVVNNHAALVKLEDQLIDVISECPVQLPSEPFNVQMTSFWDHNEITWEDTSSYEIGFRVDRRFPGYNWHPVAYRPRHSLGTPENEQAWYDYTLGDHQGVTYRVIALSCDDSDIYSYVMNPSFSKANFILKHNYPNPFNSNTLIAYELMESGSTNILIYNQRGQIIRNLLNKNQLKGHYTLQWDGTDNDGFMVPSGLYVVQLKHQQRILCRKMLLIK